MNWRLATIINGAIALITISAVVFGLNRSRAKDQQHREADASASGDQLHEQHDRDHPAGEIHDISDVRVDNLGVVAAAELGQLMARATSAELAAMAAKFNNLPVDGHTLAGLGMFFQAWAELDPKVALAGAFRLKDVTLRKLAAGTVLHSVSPSAAPELTALLLQHPDPDLMAECKNGFLGELLERWSLIDPDAASKFLDGLGDTKNSLMYNASSNIAYAWGTLDPEAAFEWIARQSKTGRINGDSLYVDVINGWCDKDIEAAAAYVAQRLDNPAAREAASMVARAMFTKDPARATSWLRQLPPGDARSEGESAISSAWSQKDPVAASRWMATLPQDEQEAVVNTIAGAWANSNWAEASNWLATLTGDVRDQALAASVYRDEATPVDSLSLALGIKKDELRSSTIGNIVRQWAGNDVQAAQGWVNSSGLPPEEKEELLSDISNMGAEVERVTN